jgi:hypothetical protein
MRIGAIGAIAAIVGGAALVVVAFAAATQVADTREGLVAEVITLLASLVGVGLLLYGLTARRTTPTMEAIRPTHGSPPTQRPRTARDLLLGAGGIALAVILVAGLAFSGGTFWAVLGLALLLPMISGSVYLFVRFLRANP